MSLAYVRGHLPCLAFRVIVHVPVVSGHTTRWGAEHEDVKCVCVMNGAELLESVKAATS